MQYLGFKEIIIFLQELSENNNKDWFDENRKRYTELRNYFIDFTEKMIQEITKFDASVHFVEPRKSIFRINRDIRFAKDKSPYKNNFGAFIVSGGKKSGNAGYYLHIQPDNSFIAGGVYNPSSLSLDKIRWSIFENIDEFLGIIKSSDFVKNFGKIEGRKLKNPPRGFDKTFEYIDLLKYKDYTVVKNIKNPILYEDNFLKKVTADFSKIHNLNLFINNALLY